MVGPLAVHPANSSKYYSYRPDGKDEDECMYNSAPVVELWTQRVGPKNALNLHAIANQGVI